MAIPVELPKLGNTVEECLVARWLKHPGDAVSEGETVVEIETDKAVQEIASPVSGTLLATFFPEGELVPVFTNLFVVGERGEEVDRFRPRSANSSAVSASSDPEPVPVTASAVSAGGDVSTDTGTATSEARMSPRARRFAQEHSFHPSAVHGSGPDGRIVEEDLRRLYVSAPGAQHQAAGEPLPPISMEITAVAEKLPPMRLRIAARMRESLLSTAQYTLHTTANASGLLTLRARVKASRGIPDANINDMVMYCAVRALLEVPGLNVEFVDGHLLRHSEVHLGIAVDTPRGLIVPVIRNAHKLSLGSLAARAKDLSAAAVQGSISPDDLSGATFTVSNLGGLGIESFTPILNPPQVAILGVDAVQLKPVRRDGRVEFVDAIGLSLTLDHQVIDGAPGARFLKVLREKIENVEMLCAI